MSSWVTIKEKEKNATRYENVNQNIEATLYSSRTLYSLALSHYNDSNDDVNNIHWSRTKESLVEIMNTCTSGIVDIDLIQQEYKPGSHGAQYQNLYYLSSKLLSKMYEIENNKSMALEIGILSTICMIHYKSNEVNLFDDNLLLNIGKLALHHNDLWATKNILQIIADKYDDSNKVSSILYLWKDLNDKLIRKCDNLCEVVPKLPFLPSHDTTIIHHNVKLVISINPVDTIISVIKVFKEFFDCTETNKHSNKLNDLVIEAVDSIDNAKGNVLLNESLNDVIMTTGIIDNTLKQDSITITESDTHDSPSNVQRNDSGRSTRSKGISEFPSATPINSTSDDKDIKNNDDFCTAEIRQLLRLNTFESINTDSCFPSITAYFSQLNELCRTEPFHNLNSDKMREKPRVNIETEVNDKMEMSRQLNNLCQEFHEKIMYLRSGDAFTIDVMASFITFAAEMAVLYTTSKLNTRQNGDAVHIIDILKKVGLMFDSDITSANQTKKEEKLGTLITNLWEYIVNYYNKSNQLLFTLIKSLGLYESLFIAECCLDKIIRNSFPDTESANDEVYYTTVNMILSNLTTVTHCFDDIYVINNIRKLRLLLLYSLPVQSSSSHNRTVKCNVLSLSLWEYLDTMITKYVSFEFLGLTRWPILNESIVKILKSFYIDSIIIIDLEREYYAINNIEKSIDLVLNWVNKVESLISSTDTEFISILASCSQRYELDSTVIDKSKSLPLLYLQGLYMLITTHEANKIGTSRKLILTRWLSYIVKLLDGLLCISFGSPITSDGTDINLNINVPQHVHIWCNEIILGINDWLPLDKAPDDDLREFFYALISGNDAKVNPLDLLFVQINKIISRLTILINGQIVPENSIKQVIGILGTIFNLAYLLIEIVDKKHTEFGTISPNSESDKFKELLNRIRYNFVKTLLYCYKEFSLCDNLLVMEVLVQLSKIIYNFQKHIPNEMRHHFILPSALNIIDVTILIPQCNNSVKVTSDTVLSLAMNAIYFVLEYVCQNTILFRDSSKSRMDTENIAVDTENIIALSCGDFIHILSNLHEIITDNLLFKYHNGKLNKILLDKLMSVFDVKQSDFYNCYHQFKEVVVDKDNIGVYLEILGQMYYYLYQLPLIHTIENFSLGISKVWESKNEVIRVYNLIKLCEIYNGFLLDTKDCICSRSDIKNALSYMFSKCQHFHKMIKTPAHFTILRYLNDPSNNDDNSNAIFIHQLRMLHYAFCFNTSVGNTMDELWELFLKDFYHHLLLVGGLNDQCYNFNSDYNEHDKLKLRYSRIISLCLYDLSYYPLRFQTWVTFFEHCVVLLHHYNDLLTELSFPDTLPNELDHIVYECLLNSLDLDCVTNKLNFSDNASTLVRTILNQINSDQLNKIVSPLRKAAESSSSKIYCDILMKKNSLVILISKLMSIIDSFNLAQIPVALINYSSNVNTSVNNLVDKSVETNNEIDIDERLEKGSVITCNWKDTGEYYSGIIIGKRLALENDTGKLVCLYDIFYDDRDIERDKKSFQCKSFNVTAMCYESYATCMYILAQGYENINKKHLYYLQRSKSYYDKAIHLREKDASHLTSSFIYFMSGKLSYSISSATSKFLRNEEKTNADYRMKLSSNVLVVNYACLSNTINRLSRAYDIENGKIRDNDKDLSTLVNIVYTMHSIRIKSILSYLMLDSCHFKNYYVEQFIMLLDKSTLNFDREKNTSALLKSKDLYYDFVAKNWTINRQQVDSKLMNDQRYHNEYSNIHDDLWRHLIFSLMVLDDCLRLTPSDFKCVYRIANTQYFLYKWNMHNVSIGKDMYIPQWVLNIVVYSCSFRDVLVRPTIALRSFNKLFEKRKQQIVAIWCLETAISPYDKLLQRTAKFDKLRRKYIVSYIDICSSVFLIDLNKNGQYNSEILNYLINLYINLSSAHHETYNKKLSAVCEIPTNKEVPNITLKVLTVCFNNYILFIRDNNKIMNMKTFNELLKQVYLVQVYTSKMNKIIVENYANEVTKILICLHHLILNNRVYNVVDIIDNIQSDENSIIDVCGNVLSFGDIQTKLQVFMNSHCNTADNGTDIFAITKLCVLLYGSNVSNRSSFYNNHQSKRKSNNNIDNDNDSKMNKVDNETNNEDMTVVI